MAGTATLYLEQRVLGHTLGFQAYTMPTNVYVGLCTTLPSSTAGGAEIVGGAYARQRGTFALASSPANVASNSATIDFPAATTDWGDIGWFEIWDAVTSGNRLFWGPLVDPADGVTPINRSITVGDILRFTAGVLQVQAI